MKILNNILFIVLSILVSHVKADYVFVNSWGSFGTGEGQFNSLHRIAVDFEGYVYASDWNSNRIQKFTKDGIFVLEWGSPGTGNGQFNHPHDITIDSSGYVYVVDYHNDRIQKFTNTGEYVSQWGQWGSNNGDFMNPWGIAIDSLDNIYVTDYYNNRVQIFSTDGDFLGKIDGFNIPHAIGVDLDGNIYVGDLDYSVKKFNSEGYFLFKWGSKGQNSGEFNFPSGIDFDSNGNILVADDYNHRVQKFSPEGIYLDEFGDYGTELGQFKAVFDLAVGSNGYIYVTDPVNNRIQVFIDSSSDPIQAIVDFIKDSINNGTLYPVKEGKPGEGQLNALVSMIWTAGDLIDADVLSDACGQLSAAHAKTDGLYPPDSAPDFVAGEAAPELAGMIQELIINLGCE